MWATCGVWVGVSHTPLVGRWGAFLRAIGPAGFARPHHIAAHAFLSDVYSAVGFYAVSVCGGLGDFPTDRVYAGAMRNRAGAISKLPGWMLLIPTTFINLTPHR